ncbi:MAG: very short patch repair endonuclease [Actinomycetota bacterium]
MGLSRSEHMGRVKGKNTSPERLLRSALWEAGLRYRLNYKVPMGRPDIVFPGPKVAVSVDGCFWHGCPAHYSRPRSREEFWSEKLAANVERDSRLTIGLETLGWIVVRVWEHEVFTDLDGVVALVRRAVAGEPPPEERDWRVIRVIPVPHEGQDWERRELCLLRDPGVVRYEVGPRKTGRGKGSPKAVRTARARSPVRRSSGSGR